MKCTRGILFSIIALWLVSAPNLWAKTRLSYANFFPPTHIQSQLAESWCKEVEKRTKGEVVVQYFPAGSLAKAPQTYDYVVKGMADIGMTALGYTRGRFPLSEGIDLPLGYTSGAQATAIANAIVTEFDPKEFHDTSLMYLHAHGPGLIHTVKKKVETMDDLAGLKLRGTGTSGKALAALGASPVGKSMRECYQMLQKGVVDGSAHPLEANKGWKLGEVVKYVAKTNFCIYTTTFAVFMNKDKWAKLSPEHQAVITQINEEWSVKHGQAWDESDNQGLEFFKQKGGEVTMVSDSEAAKWQTKVEPVINTYIEKAAKKGFDGKAVVDFIKTGI